MKNMQRMEWTVIYLYLNMSYTYQIEKNLKNWSKIF